MKYVLMENIMGGYGIIHGEFDSFVEANKAYSKFHHLATLTIEMMTEEEIEREIEDGSISRY